MEGTLSPGLSAFAGGQQGGRTSGGFFIYFVSFLFSKTVPEVT